jgi:hypothetical protein
LEYQTILETISFVRKSIKIMIKLKKGDLVIVQSIKQLDSPYWCSLGTITRCVSEPEGYVITTLNNEEVPLLIYRDLKDIVPIPKKVSENQLKAIMALVRSNR